MRKLLCITIDTECDRSGDWSTSNPLSFHSVARGVGGLLQPLFAGFGAVPTYLLTQEVIEHGPSAAILAKLPGRCELGTHLHADYVGPNPRLTAMPGTLCDDFQTDYPPEAEMAKLAGLTESFAKAFGRSPKVFRAGRFAANGNTIRSLRKLGYLADTSVTPHMVWKNRDGKPLSYVGAPGQPYWASSRDILAPGDDGLLEVPVTIQPKISWLSSLRHLRTRRRLDWLRPVWSSPRRMCSLIDSIQPGAEGKPAVLNMMFHSMELIPGASPYTRTEADVRHYLESLRVVLEHCQRRGVGFASLEDVHALWRA
jgi:hypothetical protein